MRVYLDCKLSVPSPGGFLPDTLFLASPEYVEENGDGCDETIEGECIELYCPNECSSSPSDDGLLVSVKWKNCFIVNENGSMTEAYLEEIKALVEKGWKITNMCTDYDDDVNVDIVGVTLVSGIERYEFPERALCKGIEYVA